jgi:sialic acid synthase SpsE
MQWIAEVSSNHAQDRARCLRFIDVAADIGCTGVKFQLFRVDQLFAPEILQRSAQHRARAAWELPVHFVPLIAERCHMRGLQFVCTPFYLDAVEQLYPFVEAYKIASYELPWHDLLQMCAQTGKPVILSTGMAVLAEIDDAVKTLRTAGCQDLTLLHCCSGYPTPVADCNLAAIETLARRYTLPVGWSDHARAPAVLYRAIHRYAATMVEFHLDLDGQGDEYQTGHCWLPSDIASVITTVRAGYAADGDGIKQPQPSEVADRPWRADPEDGLRPLKAIRATFTTGGAA